MYYDLNAFTQPLLWKTKIAVVGSGPAGLVLARKLAESGAEVVLISSGTLSYDQDQQDLYKGTIVGNLPLVPLTGSRLRMFGGTSNHWTGHCGPFDEVDFETRDHIQDSGWLISGKELKKGYSDAQSLLELGPYTIYNSKPSTGAFAGLKEFEVSYLTQNPFRFGGEWREYFKNSKSCSVLENSNLTQVNLSDDGTSVTSLEVKSLGGSKGVISCDHAVLACGGIENARLLLNSALAIRLPCVGRYYAFHPRIIGAELHLSQPLPKDNQFQWHPRDEATVKAFLKYSADFQLEDSQPNYAMNLLNRYSQKSQEFLAALRLRNRALGNSFEGSVREDLMLVLSNLGSLAGEYGSHKSLDSIQSFSLMTYIDPTPNYFNSIALNNDTDELGMRRCTVNWSPSEDDVHYTYQFNLNFAKMAGATGLGRVKINPMMRDPDIFKKLVQESSGGGHQMGTTRMSKSEATGVVDSNLKVHGVNNLYCAGSSVFPTYSWVNPTMTIVALSSRLADHLIDVI